LDLCLIGMATFIGWVGIVLEISVALGMVIFVHELGHFAVAKLCGVKCEKFYLGFDIFGLKICKFKYGETEYGIGILPLGGYVKMLGQEDNPAKLREEIERAKQGGTVGLTSSAVDNTGGQATRGTQVSTSGERNAGIPAATAEASTGGQPSCSTLDHAAAALYDPRSFLSKSVPNRMAIISAGVIMNVIFAFICAVVAYRLGVTQLSAGVGGVTPGSPAWQIGIKVGDEIKEIAGKKVGRYQDVQTGISLGENISEGLSIDVARPGVKEPIKFNVVPSTTGKRPTIGVLPPSITTLLTEGPPFLPGSVAARAEPEFKSGDKIVCMGDQPIKNYEQIHSYLATHQDDTITVLVERTTSPKKTDAGDAGSQADDRQTTEIISISLPPQPMRILAPGLEMTLGAISAIQVDSPAANAGLQVGDLIRKINDEPVGDPMFLPERIRKMSLKSSEETVNVTVERDGAEMRIDNVKLRQADSYEQPRLEDNPMDIPQLGIAYHVLNRVAAVDPDSRAAEAGLKPGDVVLKATVIPPEQVSSGEKNKEREVSLDFKNNPHSWPTLAYAIQHRTLGSRVELTLENDEKIVLEPVTSSDWFNPDRGLLFEHKRFTQTASDWIEACKLGGRETWESLTLVVLILRNIGTRISLDSFGGPGMIAAIAYSAAKEGPAALLIFLTMLSANLAVLNFLPIPLLDGGLFVLLAYEGIRGKPASERVQVILTYIGLAFILTLMIWVIRNDIKFFLFPSGW
jgi:regulator of sigma E protease